MTHVTSGKQPSGGWALFGIVRAGIVIALLLCSFAAADDEITLRMTLRDQVTGEFVPGRIYVEQHVPGEPPVYHHVRSLSPDGSAVPYDVVRSQRSVETHTTVSAHPFGAALPPGFYWIYYEHGPEFQDNKTQVTIREGETATVQLPTWRWIDMAERGWYSGDTHVHRSIEDLPNIMRAEDLNVALPLSYWVRKAHTPPLRADKNVAVEPRLITVDPQRVIWPMNTEYELFSVNGRQHTLGAVFVLNHDEPLTLGAPPVAPIAAEARRQGALLDLDKHSWPWSLMIAPVMNVDLFELANNHIWRTKFHFKAWTIEMRPADWNIETDAGGYTEWGWIDFGFQTYYALLNCGLRMRPTAGTASGVHPVPLGYGRVYVHLPRGFSYQEWMDGLEAGRSFVTTGPMLFATVDGHEPGSTIQVEGPTQVRVRGMVEGKNPLGRVEIVRNGRVVDVIPAKNEYESPRIYRTPFDVQVPVETTSWIAVRCFEDKQGGMYRKMTFAHTSPVQIEMPGRPLRPWKVETDYLVGRMKEEIARNRDVLPPDALGEYEQALDFYRKAAEHARDAEPITNEQLLSLAVPADDLPEGWSRSELSETELKSLGGNPAVISQPLMLGEFVEIGIREGVDEANVLRMMASFYNTPSKSSEPGMWLSAFVCADSASARAAMEALQSPEHLQGAQIHIWREDNLVIWLVSERDLPASEFVVFKKLVEERLEKTFPE